MDVYGKEMEYSLLNKLMQSAYLFDGRLSLSVQCFNYCPKYYNNMAHQCAQLITFTVKYCCPIVRGV